jgi:hypothetical protein
MCLTEARASIFTRVGTSHRILNMETYKPEKHDVDTLSRQTTTAEGHLEKKFSKLTMTGMAFAILKYSDFAP